MDGGWDEWMISLFFFESSQHVIIAIKILTGHFLLSQWVNAGSLFILDGETEGPSCLDGRRRTDLLLSWGGIWNFDAILHGQQTQK